MSKKLKYYGIYLIDKKKIRVFNNPNNCSKKDLYT